MTATAFTAVVAAVEAKLKASPPVSALVRRGHGRPLQEGQSDSVTVRRVRLDPTDRDMPMAFDESGVWQIQFGVECAVRSQDIDDDLDAFVQKVYARLMGDPTLGGVVRPGITPQGIVYDFEQDGERVGSAVIVFTARREAGPDLT